MTYRNCLYMTIILLASIWMFGCGESTSDESENRDGDATGDADADADNEEDGDDDNTADDGAGDADAGDNSSSADEDDADGADDGDADDAGDGADDSAEDGAGDSADDGSDDDPTDDGDGAVEDDDATDDSSVDDDTVDDSGDDIGDEGDGDGGDAGETDDADDVDDVDDTPVDEDTDDDVEDTDDGDGDGDEGVDTEDDDSGDVTSTGECSATASEGLAVGDLVPNVELQRCDGTPVTLRELVCGQAELTHVYSFTEMCPGCTGFMGLEGGMDMGTMNAESLYADYHDKGYELLVIYSGTEDFMNSEPTAADCQELEDQIVGTLVFDSTGKKTQEELDLPLKGGSALAGSDGTWVTAPPGKDAGAEEGGLGDVFMTLMTELGGFGGMGGGMGGGK